MCYDILNNRDKKINRDYVIIVCLPGTIIDHMTERAKKVMDPSNFGLIIVHVCTHYTDRRA